MAAAASTAHPEGPIPFITVDEATNKFAVADEAVSYLRSLNPKRRLAIVSIAGMYRTGKSYILNMMMGRPAGFEVGPTVRACTKGIWLWGGVIRAKDMPQGDVAGAAAAGAGEPGAAAADSDEEVDVLFMDTEGLGSTSRSETYDSRVFALALLLSSYFVYNSTGTIDGAAISKLSLVVNLTKHIHVRAHSRDADTGSEFGQFFPQFLWVVRDFGVRLERDGRRISARDYLEDSLKPEAGMGESVESKNAVRLLLRSFFPERDCVTMVRPVTDEAKLARLASEPWSSLRPEFQAQVDALRRRVFGGARPKAMFGQPVTGAMLVELAVAYTEAMNDNRAPTISTAWERVVDSRCAEAAEAALREFDGAAREAMEAAAAEEEEARAAEAAAEAGKGGDGDDDDDDGDDGTAAATAAVVAEVRAAASSSEAAAMARPVVSSASALRATDAALARAQAVFRRDAVKDDARAEAYAQRVVDGAAERRRSLLAANEEASAARCAAVASAAWKVSAAAAPSLPAGGEGADPPTASMVVDAARRRLAAFRRAFGAVAAGPAADRVLAAWVGSRPLAAAAADADTCDTAARRRVLRAAEELEGERRARLESEGRLRVAEEAGKTERMRLQSLMDAAATEAATRQESLRAQLEAATDERRRAEARAERAAEAAGRHEAELRAEAESARQDGKAARRALTEAQAGALTRLEGKLDSAAELAAARARLSELEAAAAEARVASAEARKDAGVAAEIARAATASTAGLEREAELLRESLEVKKGLVATLTAEKEELEYQWGSAKAENASLESEKLRLMSRDTCWQTLCGQLKAERRRPPTTLDEMERRLYASV